VASWHLYLPLEVLYHIAVQHNICVRGLHILCRGRFVAVAAGFTVYVLIRLGITWVHHPCLHRGKSEVWLGVSPTSYLPFSQWRPARYCYVPCYNMTPFKHTQASHNLAKIKTCAALNTESCGKHSHITDSGTKPLRFRLGVPALFNSVFPRMLTQCRLAEFLLTYRL
jgi:hypothetical protein